MWSYLVQEICWLQCPKAPLSEHRSRVNLFTCPKHCVNQHGSTFIIISHWKKSNWVTKHLFQSDVKSQYCLLTSWLATTCILAIIETIYRNMFKDHYLKNEKHILEFLFDFWNLYKILRIIKKRDQVTCLNICEAIESRKCVDLNSRKLLF